MKPAIPEWEKAIAKEYRLAYKDILSEETIETSLVWFLGFLEPIIVKERRKAAEEAIKAVTPPAHESGQFGCDAIEIVVGTGPDKETIPLWNNCRYEVIRKGEDYLKTL